MLICADVSVGGNFRSGLTIFTVAQPVRWGARCILGRYRSMNAADNSMRRRLT